jgi:MFS family permease
VGLCWGRLGSRVGSKPELKWRPSEMKRILVLLTVVALMMVTLAMAVAPAFAQGELEV